MIEKSNRERFKKRAEKEYLEDKVDRLINETAGGFDKKMDAKLDKVLDALKER